MIIMFGCQNISFRGHREHFDLLDEEDNGTNSGNFIVFLKYMINKNPDSALRNYYLSAAKNAQYTSPEIQNELIDCCAAVVQV